MPNKKKSIDQLIENQEVQDSPKTEEKEKTLEQKTEELKPLHEESFFDQKRSLAGKIWDITKYAAMMGGLYAGLTFVGLPAASMIASSYIPAIGFTLGAIYDNKKNKLKNTWRRIYKEFSFGNLVGLMDFMVLSLPEKLISLAPGFFGKNAIPNQVAKTLMFNPLVSPLYLFVYNSIKTVRDYIGLNPLKIASNAGRIAKKATSTIKEETKSIFKYLFVPHYVQMNMYGGLPEAVRVPARMLQSVLLNNPMFRIITGRKQPKETPQKKYERQPYSVPQAYRNLPYAAQPA